MKHILIADDEANIRLLFQEELEEAGYKITTATDGAEALEMTLQEQPDLVLLDIRMPNVNGLEFMEKLRGEHHSKIPVIVCTALKGLEQDFEIWDTHVSAILNKPIDLDELKDKVKEVLGE